MHAHVDAVIARRRQAAPHAPGRVRRNGMFQTAFTKPQVSGRYCGAPHHLRHLTVRSWWDRLLIRKGKCPLRGGGGFETFRARMSVCLKSAVRSRS
jgi:hypothetical protein